MSIKILIGLEAQGHIKTIENYFKNNPVRIIKNTEGEDIKINPVFHKYHWDEIGRIIGWCPFNACLEYFKYLEKNKEVKSK